MPYCYSCQREYIARDGIIRCYNDNNKLIHEIYIKNNIKHRDDGPAESFWNDDNLTCEEYYLNNKSHRTNGPAYREWNSEGNLTCEEYYINGMLHREDGPALSTWNDNGQFDVEQWYINGHHHREDGPSYISNNNGKIYGVWIFWSLPHTFGLMKTHNGKSYKKGLEVHFNNLIRSGKVILRFMRRTKDIRKRYEKLLEKSISWSFPGLGKILLELNGKV